LFIVVQKKINTKLFAKNARGEFVNPPPGTLLSRDVVLHERQQAGDPYDFFLVSPDVNRGLCVLCWCLFTNFLF